MPEEVSYKAITLESPAVANSFPVGENASDRTGFTKPKFDQLIERSIEHIAGER
jgi:hypothetical protein